MANKCAKSYIMWFCYELYAPIRYQSCCISISIRTHNSI